MLVLTVYPGDAVRIGPDVTIIHTRGGRVRLGIEAPAGARIERLGRWRPADLQAAKELAQAVAAAIATEAPADLTAKLD